MALNTCFLWESATSINSATSFAKGEIGARHEPEFTMVEWYRCGFSFEKMISETLEFIQLFLGKKTSTTFIYREIFKTHAGIDYMQASIEQLIDCAKRHELALSFEKGRVGPRHSAKLSNEFWSSPSCQKKS